MKRLTFLPVALAVVALACGDADRNNAPATNDTESASSPVGTSGDADRSRVPDDDAEFVREVAVANTAEIELGRMAVERASGANVKKFAQMMIDDHTRAAGTLGSVAGRYAIELPTQLDDEHRELRDRLAGLKGAEFDREYMAAMVDAHEDLLDTLGSRTDQKELENWKSRRASAAGKNQRVEIEALTVVPEKSDNAVTMNINQWAAETYPVVYAHVEAAKDAEAGVKARATR
ncbi:MAG: DUF4142 domain-containing protein [Vicinamibacterales bacterium]